MTSETWTPPADVDALCECGHVKGDHYMRYGSDPANPDWSPVACIGTTDENGMSDPCDCEWFATEQELADALNALPDGSFR